MTVSAEIVFVDDNHDHITGYPDEMYEVDANVSANQLLC